MTVTQESSKSPLYQGDGSITAFAFNFKVLSSDHLLVYKYNVDTEVSTLLTKDIDYTVALASGGESGGLVNMVSAPAINEKLRIFRNTPKDQQMNIANQGNFYPGVLNGSADKAVLMIQEIIDILERAIILDPMSPETPDDLYARINEAKEIAEEALGKLDTVTDTANTALANSSTAIDTANTALDTAQSSYEATVEYINNTLAQWFASQGTWENPVVWTTTLDAGQQMITTPFKFTQGLFFYGGTTYVLNNFDHAVLDQTQSNTRIMLNDPVSFDGTGVLVVLNTNVPLQATWSGNISAGEDEITTDFTSTQLNAGGFVIVGGNVYNLSDVTIVGSVITLPDVVLADHEVILVLLSQ